MKRLLVTLTLLFVSLNIVACAEKKEHKTRLTQGAGRTSGVNGAPSGESPAVNSGWNDLNNNGPEEVYLTSQNPNDAARKFLSISSDNSDFGTFEFNSIVMRLTFRNGQIDANNTRVGFRFWDNGDNPMSYFTGKESGATISGSKNGNNVRVVFNDGGTITVEGTVMGGTFSGRVTYDGNNELGRFSVTASESVYGY